MKKPVEFLRNDGAEAAGCDGVACSRITVEEIARRLKIGRLAVYKLLERGIIPSVRIGRRWIVTRWAYEEWERTCGMHAGAGLPPRAEVTVLN